LQLSAAAVITFQGEPRQRKDAMIDSATVEELDAQIELRKKRFKQVTDDIRAVLREDLPAFVLREVKKAFLTHVEVASKMSKEDVAELKVRAASVAREIVASVDEALGDSALWLAPAEVPKNQRDISGATRVWAEVRRVEAALAELLDAYGLRGSETPLYKAPAYFVKGNYLPSLAEHYWRLVHEVQELEAQKGRIASDATRADLEAKWEEA